MRVRSAIVLAGLAAVVAAPMAAAAPAAPAGVPVINTFAGTGESGESGDGGSATKAKLDYPAQIAIDGTGAVYFDQSHDNPFLDTIRKVDAKGVISTVVGTGDQLPTKDVLVNDTGSRLTVTAHTDPKNGTVTLPASGKFGYRPKDGFTGEDSFNYTVTDDLGQTATAKVTITVGTAGGGGTPTTEPPAPQGSNPPTTGGGLASTGASVIGLTAAALVLLGVGGGLIAFTARRRRTRR